MARKRKGIPLHGWFIIDKPEGMTSTQVIGRVRRLTNAMKLGHGGTLDPLATGILPIALGEATKVIPFVMDATKVYRFTVRWGQATSTDDAEGEVIETSDHRPTDQEIVGILPQFTGEIWQRPPLYSAIKIAGERAYDLARRGESVEIDRRKVRVERIALVDTPEKCVDSATFEVICGKGTYIRSLARDMGKALGTCGYVTMLRRTRVGPFSEAGSISLDMLEKLLHSAPPEEHITPVETVLDDIPALAVTGGEADRLKMGQSIRVPGERHGTVRVMSDDRLIAIAEVTEGQVQPFRVFNL